MKIYAMKVKCCLHWELALAGGSTPRSIYALLASEAWHVQLPWEKMHFFWGDEHHVPPDQADSNYRMAHEAMLAHVPVPVENVHRIKAENPNARSLQCSLRLGG